MNTDKEIKTENRTRAPWYYYLLGLFLYSVTTTLLKLVAHVNGGGLLELALVGFFIIYLPRQMWESKNNK